MPEPVAQPGIIDITLRHGKVRIQGAVDESTLQLLLRNLR